MSPAPSATSDLASTAHTPGDPTEPTDPTEAHEAIEANEATAAGTTTSATRTPARRPVLDAAVAAAVDVARSAALEAASEEGSSAPSAGVGDHLGVSAEGDRVGTHLFACTLPGYQGWRWAVTVVRASRAKAATLSEVVLLPGPDSLLAPAWLPWAERIAPGDLGVGDVMATDPDDERLVPGYAAVSLASDDSVDGPDADVEPELVGQLAYELGLGRPRVLSPVGRELAATRWYEGSHGPDAPIAQAAPARCITCGFLTPLRGFLAGVFGVCTNEWSPSDGRVVSYDHGCGAHSEAPVAPVTVRANDPVVDTTGFDPILDDDRDL